MRMSACEIIDSVDPLNKTYSIESTDLHYTITATHWYPNQLPIPRTVCALILASPAHGDACVSGTLWSWSTHDQSMVLRTKVLSGTKSGRRNRYEFPNYTWRQILANMEHASHL